MSLKIAVFGNQPLNLGYAIAADLAFSGHEVNFFDLPGDQDATLPLKKLGGIQVSGDPRELVSGKTGLARLNMITTNPETALKDADVLFIDAPIHAFEARLGAIAPFIRNETVLHFNYFGYWSSLRVANVLRKAGKEEVILTECPSSLYYARGKDGFLDFQVMKKELSVSVFPSEKSTETFSVLNQLYPQFMPAKNVLHTNFENQNILWHPPIALLNVAHFDRLKKQGETSVHFYNTGITEHTARLTETQDKEREALCNAYGVPYTPLADLIKKYVGGTGKTMAEIQMSSNFIQHRPSYDIDLWTQWLQWDVPFGLVPMVSLADLAGIPMPVHRGLIDLFCALFQTDFWAKGAGLRELGLEGLSVNEIVQYVTKGW